MAKKAIGLYAQNPTIRTCVTPFYTFSSRRRMTAIWTSSFSTGAQNKNFLFFFLNIDMVLPDSTPENFAKINIWQIKWSWIRSLKFETVRTRGPTPFVMMFELRAEMYGDIINALIIIIIRWILIYKTKKVSLIYAQVNVECKTLQIATIRCFQLQQRQYATF